MLLQFFKLLPISILAHAAILAGIFFTSGHLLPNVLAGIYTKTTELTRMLMSLPLFFFFGNFMVAKSYQWFDPGLVTPVNIFNMIILSVAMTVVFFGLKPHWTIIPATLTVAAGCIWVNLLIRQPL